jgi:hypothetical protein
MCIDCADLSLRLLYQGLNVLGMSLAHVTILQSTADAAAGAYKPWQRHVRVASCVINGRALVLDLTIRTTSVAAVVLKLHVSRQAG